MNKEEQLLALIHKQSTNELTETEGQQLESLLNDPDAKLVADQVTKIWDKSLDYKKGYEPDVEAGLVKFKSRIKATSNKPETKVVKLGRRKWISQIAAASVLIAGCWLGWNTFFSNADEQLAAIDKIENVQLADATKVTLNQGSQLDFPKTFSDSERLVELKGEAFFDVAKNPTKPFIIKSGNVQIKVLGTSFNVRNFENEDVAEITVATGRVEVSTLDGSEKWILNPNDQLVINKKDKKAEPIAKDEKQIATGWMSKKLFFNNERLSVVKKSLERVYNVQLRFTDKSTLDCLYSDTKGFENKSLDDILDLLKVGFQFEKIEKVSDKEYRLVGGSCPKPNNE